MCANRENGLSLSPSIHNVNITRLTLTQMKECMDRAKHLRVVLDRDVSDSYNVSNTAEPIRRNRHAEIPHKVSYRNAITITAAQSENLCTNSHNCGSLSEVCPYCGALFDTLEKTNRDGSYTKCCNREVYSLPILRECPPALRNLFTGDGPLANQFRKQIRYINVSLCHGIFLDFSTYSSEN